MLPRTDPPESLDHTLATDLLTAHRMMTLFDDLRTERRGIRPLIFSSLLCLLPFTSAASQSVSLEWDPNSETNLAGYVIYYGTASGRYSSSNILNKTPNTRVSGLQEGVNYYFAVTAYDTVGLESDLSDEVSYQVPTLGPTISAISNQVTPEDMPKAVSFTVSRGTNQTGVVSFTALSSDSSLVPATNIVVAGTLPNLTATLTPRPNAFGLTTITVLFSNGLQSASRSFVFTVNPVNDVPTLNPIGNLAILEYAGLQTVALTGISSGAANENQTLSITAVSSNPSLIPTPAVTYASPNSTGTLRFTPVPNASGSATITVTINDGQGINNITTRSFNVAVAAVNDAPTISGVLAQHSSLDKPTVQIPIVIHDIDSSSLSLSSSSTNSTLLPTNSIVFSGTGSNRTVLLTPAPGQTGESRIVLAVTDGLLTATTTFLLTVTPSNAPPTITTITNQATDYYTPLVSIRMRVADVETPAGNLTLSATSANPSVLPATNITFGGSGSNRTMAIMPVVGRSGTVVISVSVRDGNSSTMTSFQLTVQTPQRPLVLTTRGVGTVSPDLNGKLLTAGRSYTLKAIPGTGQVFVGWSGSITSAATSIKFHMSSNFSLEAKFMTNPYTPFKGTYTGLYYEMDEVRHERSGLLNLVTTSRGNYTGRLRRGTHSYPLSGHLDFGCRATNSIRHTGTNVLRVELQLVATRSGDQVRGRVTDGNWVAGLLGDRAVFHTVTNRAPSAGYYTMVLPGDVNAMEGSGGDGFGTASVTPRGNVLLKARAADGTALTQTVPLSLRGEFPLYVPLYGGKGSMLGWLSFTNRPDEDLTGLVSWIRPGIRTATYYRAGFTNETEVIGSSYVSPDTKTNRVVELTNGMIRFTGGNLAGALTSNIILSNNNRVLNLSSNKLVMKINPQSGLFSGSKMNPATGKLLHFRGVMVQKRNAGSGYFLGTNQSGRAYFGP